VSYSVSVTIRERINQVLQNWCGQSTPDQSQNLKMLWESTADNDVRPHDGMDFQPDGVEDLIGRLTDEFKRPGPVRKAIVLQAGDFEPDGTILTIDDLVGAVVTSDNLP
jgi:hypothetical protein